MFNPEQKKFAITMRRGFQMILENGILVSVQWGAGNYCENHYSYDRSDPFSEDAISDNAEVAAWHVDRPDNDYWMTNEFLPENKRSCCDVVAGWLTPEEVIDFLAEAKKYDPSTGVHLKRAIEREE